MWVLAVLAIVVALLILALCVPVDMVLHADSNGKPKLHLRFSWLFGLVSKEVTKREKKPEEKKEKVEGKRKRGEIRERIKFIFEIIRTRGLLKQLKDLIQGILSCLKIRNFVVNLKIGLDNPADTGFLFAVIGPPITWLNSHIPHHITVQPSFEGGTVFEGYSSGKVRLRPIQLVIPILKFVFSLATIRVIKTVISSKWGKKR